MPWIVLVVAGLLEVGWAVTLKFTDGFTRLVPSVITVIFIVASVLLLGVAVRSIPIGTAYAVWTGIGAVGTVICGILVLGESASAARLICVSLIIVGIAGLKLVSQH
jgi:quaternary ammonium compound-resistance protein SugE